jgi:uncharacterized protein (DUF2236 family)
MYHDAGKDLAQGPGTLHWAFMGDWRLYLMAGRGLLLQVAHPTVGAGVGEHSTFKTDPWGRLERSVDALVRYHCGADGDAQRVCRQLREMHKRIKGVDHRGRRYHALEPEAFYWVHGTAFEGAIVMSERFGRPLTETQIARLYTEHKQVGLMLGLHERDMPPDVPAFRRFFDEMVEERLEDNPTVHDVIAMTRNPPKLPSLPIPGPAWRLLTFTPTTILHAITVGTLPPRLRERLGLEWSAAQELELRAIAAAVRQADALLPDRLRYVKTARDLRRNAALA